MDNIITTTLALAQRRKHKEHQRDFTHRLYYSNRGKKHPCRLSDMYWVDPATAKFHVFYRIAGTVDLNARPNIEIKLYLMPCFMVAGVPEIYGIFQDAFVLYAYLSNIKVHDAEWISIDARVTRYPSQPITAALPVAYHPRIDEVLRMIPFPSHSTERKREGNTPSLDNVSDLRFCRFHFYYRPSSVYKERFGIVDQMWDEYGHALPLNLPPALDFTVKEGDPSENPLYAELSKRKITQPTGKKLQSPLTAPLSNATTSASSIPNLEDELNSFLKTNRSSVIFPIRR